MEIASWQTILFFIANSLYASAYMVTSIFWLRILSIAAACSTLPYFFFQSEPLWSALFWQILFVSVNVAHLILLYIKSLPTKLTPLEEKIKTLVFRNLSIGDLRKVVKDASTRTYQPGEVILRQGQPNAKLLVLLKGGCSVCKDGKRIAHLVPGQFIGEISFITENTATADVIAEQATEVAYWANDSLNKLFSNNSSLHKYMVTLLGHDLALKLST